MGACAVEVATEHVFRVFPGLGLVPIGLAWAFLGGAEKSARNLLSLDAFPLPTVRVGHRRLVPTPVLISYYANLLKAAGFADSQSMMAEAPKGKPIPLLKKRGRGRPRKC